MNPQPKHQSTNIWIDYVNGISSNSLRWAKIIFTPIAILFLSMAALHSWDNLSEVIKQAHLSHILIAVLVWMITHLLSPVFTYVLISACSPLISYRLALSIHISRLPARYLPGGIWHTVARITDLYTHGIQPKHLTVFVFLENIIAISITFIFGGLTVAWHQEPGVWRMFSLLAALGGSLALCVSPIVINRWILKSSSPLPLKGYLAAIITTCIFWLFATIAFLFYLSAFPGSLQPVSLIETGGTYLFSWGVGYIAVFAPQGIGVFEAVAGDILRSPLSFSALAALVAGFRLVIIAADTTTWCVWTLSRSSYRALSL